MRSPDGPGTQLMEAESTEPGDSRQGADDHAVVRQILDGHVDGPITAPENPVRALSAVLFVNSIRRGGLLEFPRQNRTIKPEMGNLVLFPPFFSHPHLTMPTQGEPRYVFVTWLTYI